MAEGGRPPPCDRGFVENDTPGRGGELFSPCVPLRGKRLRFTATLSLGSRFTSREGWGSVCSAVGTGRLSDFPIAEPVLSCTISTLDRAVAAGRLAWDVCLSAWL